MRGKPRSAAAQTLICENSVSVVNLTAKVNIVLRFMCAYVVQNESRSGPRLLGRALGTGPTPRKALHM